MHITSPELPESALCFLFFQAAVKDESPPLSPGSMEAPINTPVNFTSGPQKNPSSRCAFAKKHSGGGGRECRGNIGGSEGVEAVSVARFARVVVEFPLVCEGLVPLVTAVATASGVQTLFKKLAAQTQEAVDETEKVGKLPLSSLDSCAYHFRRS